jgi:signal transduction histidine kinase
MPASPESVLLFNALPTPHLLLSPAFVIEAVSDSYLHATLTSRERLVGQYMFDAFPDNPQTPEANGRHNVRASLQQVLATKQPHQLAQQHYDVPDPEHPGQFVERYWQALNAPVLDAQGNVSQIIHAAVDVTAEVRAQAHLQQSQAAEQRARAEAEQQRQRFHEVLLQLPAYVAVYQGPDHVYQFVNPPYERLFPHRTFVGRSLREATPEANGLGVVALLDHVYQTGEPHHVHELEGWFDFAGTGEPEQVFLNLSLHPLRNAQGSVNGVLDFSYDVTEQVRNRRQVQQLNDELEVRVTERTHALTQALQQTERQRVEREAYYQVFEQTPALIALLRAPSHRFEYVNPAYQTLFPHRPLQGLDFAVALPEAQAQGFGALLDQVYQTGETFVGEALPLVSPPIGDQLPYTRYFDFTYQAYREAGAVAGVSIFAYDVTERVLARQEREMQRQRLYDLFLQAPAAICILTGPDLVYELVNPGYQALFPDRQLHGRPLLDALPELKGHAVHRTFLQVYETGVTWEEMGILIPLGRPEDGALEDRYFNYIQQARHDERGRIDGVLVFAFEVTEQVMARQQAQALAAELVTANQQLTRTNVDLDNFIYTASHDLKAPISNIEGLLYLLQDELPLAVQQEGHVTPTLTRMLEAVERFKRTIDHLTEVSKLQKEHAPAPTAVNLATVVEGVRQDLLSLLQETGTKLVVDVTDFPPVNFSEKNLRSIVYNLLSNAVKYRSPDRRAHVDVRAHVRPGYTVLEVHDNGLGLAAEQLPQLFGMFQRFHDHVEGTGIGLYMVKRMVENAGGRIEVHSQLGAGTTFFVQLPHSLLA